MAEITLKVEIPSGFEKEFKLALAKVIKEFSDRLEFEIAREIVSKSKFSETDAEDLSNKVKLTMHNRLKKEKVL